MAAIEAIGPPSASRAPPRSVLPTASRFSVPCEAAAASPAIEASEVAAASLASVLTLQELGAESVTDREARRHGHAMLEALALLQHVLLEDSGDEAVLERLADLVAAVPRATDRRLAAVVSAISVRVRVELARRQM